MAAVRHVFLLVALTTALAACGGSGDGRPNDSFDRRALLSNLGRNVVLPTLSEFATRTDALKAAVDGYCAALGTGTEMSTRDAARDAWLAAAVQWQRAELMQFGPAAMNAGELRDAIYSWPVTSSCAVDLDVAERLANPGGFEIATRLPNRLGLDALEYLLYRDSFEHTCPVQSPPLNWDGLADAERSAASCAFAALVAGELERRAGELHDAWSPNAGNYIGVLETAGDSGNIFGSAHEAVNVVSDAMFYLHNDTQDMKLAQPAGLTINNCPTVGVPCAIELESQFAHTSAALLAANVVGFQLLFHGRSPDGTDGVGFDDFLTELGAADFSAQMAGRIADAVTAAEAIPDPMSETLNTDLAVVVSAHAAVKAVSDDLKSQFLTVLGLEIPDAAAGDND